MSEVLSSTLHIAVAVIFRAAAIGHHQQDQSLVCRTSWAARASAILRPHSAGQQGFGV